MCQRENQEKQIASKVKSAVRVTKLVKTKKSMERRGEGKKVVH